MSSENEKDLKPASILDEVVPNVLIMDLPTKEDQSSHASSLTEKNEGPDIFSITGTEAGVKTKVMDGNLEHRKLPSIPSKSYFTL